MGVAKDEAGLGNPNGCKHTMDLLANLGGFKQTATRLRSAVKKSGTTDGCDRRIDMGGDALAAKVWQPGIESGRSRLRGLK